MGSVVPWKGQKTSEHSSNFPNHHFHPSLWEYQTDNLQQRALQQALRLADLQDIAIGGLTAEYSTPCSWKPHLCKCDNSIYPTTFQHPTCFGEYCCSSLVRFRWFIRNDGIQGALDTSVREGSQGYSGTDTYEGWYNECLPYPEWHQNWRAREIPVVSCKHLQPAKSYLGTWPLNTWHILLVKEGKKGYTRWVDTSVTVSNHWENEQGLPMPLITVVSKSILVTSGNPSLCSLTLSSLFPQPGTRSFNSLP